MNPKDQLAEIEKEIDASFEDEEYNVNCGTKRGFLLGTISQLKDEITRFERAKDLHQADLKFYEDKLKEMGE